MIPYATRTGTKRNLTALKREGWRLLLTPAHWGNFYDLRYAIDNGAWRAHVTGKPWDEAAFLRCLKHCAKDADWIALPDIVGGGEASLERSMSWMTRILDMCERVLLPVQDGMAPAWIEPLLTGRVGLFVGGTTEFKLSTMAAWSSLAAKKAAWCHIGRVNTVRRIRLCAAAGATSFDGTSASMYVKTIGKLNSARHQPDFFAP